MAQRRAPREPAEEVNLTAIDIPLPTGRLWGWKDNDSGVPVAVISQAGLDYVATMSQSGRSTVTIAHEMNMPHRIFRACMKRQKEVDEAIVLGHHSRNNEISDILMQMARGGNVQAAMFIAKAQCGWRENDTVAVAANVVVQMPAPLTMDQLMQMRESGVTPMQLPEAQARKVWNSDESVIETEGKESSSE